MSSSREWLRRSSASVRRILAEALEPRTLLTSLDPRFADAGQLTFDVGSSTADQGYDVAVQSDGKVVAVGGSAGDFAISRFNTDGSLDTTFGTNGNKTVNFGATDVAHGVTILPDGRIVAVGETSGDFALCMLTTDGALDTSFSSDGIQTKDLGSSTDTLWGCTYDSVTNRVYVVGMGDPSSYSIVGRYKLDGSLDTAWDGDGLKYQGFGPNTTTYAIQLDGKIVIAGKMGGDLIVIRYNTNGSNDTSFDSDGRQIVNLGSSDDIAYGLSIKGSGSSERILLSGKTGTGSATDAVLVQINGSSGAIDTSFGTSGKTVVSFGSSSDATFFDGLYLTDGSIVAAGRANGNAILMHFTPGGVQDTSFDDDGVDEVDFGASDDVIRSVAAASDGIVYGFGNAANDFAIARAFVLPPAAPTAISTTPVDSSSIALQWADASSTETSYLIQRAASSNFSDAIDLATTDIDTQDFLDVDLASAGIYYYRVAARNAAGTSAWSSKVGYTLSAAATDVTLASSDGYTVNVTWTAPAGVSSQLLERSTMSDFSSDVSSFSLSSTASSYADLVPTSYTTYYYRLSSASTVSSPPTGVPSSIPSAYASGNTEIAVYPPVEFFDGPPLEPLPSVSPKITVAGMNLAATTHQSGEVFLRGNTTSPNVSTLKIMAGNTLHVSAVGELTDPRSSFTTSAVQGSADSLSLYTIDWSFGESGRAFNTVRGFNAAHVYDVYSAANPSQNVKTVTLTITKPGGAQVSTSMQIEVIANPAYNSGRTIYVASVPATVPPADANLAGLDPRYPTGWASLSSKLSSIANTPLSLGGPSPLGAVQVLFHRGDTIWATSSTSGKESFRSVGGRSVIGLSNFKNVIFGNYKKSTESDTLPLPEIRFSKGNVYPYSIQYSGGAKNGKTETTTGSNNQPLLGGPGISNLTQTWNGSAYVTTGRSEGGGAATSTLFGFSGSNQQIRIAGLRITAPSDAELGSSAKKEWSRTGVLASPVSIKNSTNFAGFNYISITDCEINNLYEGVDSKASAVLLQTIRNVSVAGGNDYQRGRMGSYFYFGGGSGKSQLDLADPNGMGSDSAVIQGCLVGDTYQVNHNVRTYTTRLAVYGNDLLNYIDNDNPAYQVNGYCTLRANAGEYIYWGFNTLRAGQMYLGLINDPPREYFVAHVVVENNRNFSIAQDQDTRTGHAGETYQAGIQDLQGGGRLSINAHPGTRGGRTVSDVTIRNNYVEGGLRGPFVDDHGVRVRFVFNTLIAYNDGVDHNDDKILTVYSETKQNTFSGNLVVGTESKQRVAGGYSSDTFLAGMVQDNLWPAGTTFGSGSPFKIGVAGDSDYYDVDRALPTGAVISFSSALAPSATAGSSLFKQASYLISTAADYDPFYAIFGASISYGSRPSGTSGNSRTSGAVEI